MLGSDQLIKRHLISYTGINPLTSIFFSLKTFVRSARAIKVIWNDKKILAYFAVGGVKYGLFETGPAEMQALKRLVILEL